jgi:hypothetical protein
VMYFSQQRRQIMSSRKNLMIVVLATFCMMFAVNIFAQSQGTDIKPDDASADQSTESTTTTTTVTTVDPSTGTPDLPALPGSPAGRAIRGTPDPMPTATFQVVTPKIVTKTVNVQEQFKKARDEMQKALDKARDEMQKAKMQYQKTLHDFDATKGENVQKAKDVLQKAQDEMQKALAKAADEMEKARMLYEKSLKDLEIRHSAGGGDVIYGSTSSGGYGGGGGGGIWSTGSDSRYGGSRGGNLIMDNRTGKMIISGPNTLEIIPSDDPEANALRDKERDCVDEIKKIVDKYNSAKSSGDRAALKTDLEKAVGQQFAIRQESRELQIKQLEKELARIRETVQKRSDNREQIIKRRVAQLLHEQDDMEF